MNSCLFIFPKAGWRGRRRGIPWNIWQRQWGWRYLKRGWVCSNKVDMVISATRSGLIWRSKNAMQMHAYCHMHGRCREFSCGMMSCSWFDTSYMETKEERKVDIMMGGNSFVYYFNCGDDFFFFFFCLLYMLLIHVIANVDREGANEWIAHTSGVYSNETGGSGKGGERLEPIFNNWKRAVYALFQQIIFAYLYVFKAKNPLKMVVFGGS